MTRTPAIIEIIQQELEAYRRSGRRVHLAHVLRLLSEELAITGTAGQRGTDAGVDKSR